MIGAVSIQESENFKSIPGNGVESRVLYLLSDKEGRKNGRVDGWVTQKMVWGRAMIADEGKAGFESFPYCSKGEEGSTRIVRKAHKSNRIEEDLRGGILVEM